MQYDGVPAKPSRAPEFNEHGDAILEELGLDWDAIVDLKGSIDFSKKSTTPTGKIQNQSDILLISSLVSMGYDKTRVETTVADIDKNGTIEIRTIEAIRQLAK